MGTRNLNLKILKILKVFKPGFLNLLSYISKILTHDIHNNFKAILHHVSRQFYNFGSYTLKIKRVVAAFHQKKIMHGKGHQMMTFTADCGPIVHVNATSQNSTCVFVQGRQFTANCCTYG